LPVGHGWDGESGELVRDGTHHGGPAQPGHRGDQPPVARVVGEGRDARRIAGGRARGDQAGAQVRGSLGEGPPGHGELAADGGQPGADPSRRLHLAAVVLGVRPDSGGDGGEHLRRYAGDVPS